MNYIWLTQPHLSELTTL